MPEVNKVLDFESHDTKSVRSFSACSDFKEGITGWENMKVGMFQNEEQV